MDRSAGNEAGQGLLAKPPSADSAPATVQRGRPLREDRALLHEEGACLPLRSRHGQCRACADACPVGALSVSIEAVSLNDACMGCGRCVATCPTGALNLPELVEATAPADAAALRLECRKVPAAALAPDSRRLPCLGALTVGQILAWHAAGTAVDLVDRGWCGGCDAYDAEVGFAGGAVLEEARLWLEALGEETLPRVVQEALPLASRPDRIPPPDAPVAEAPAMARRTLFRRVATPPPQRRVTPMGGGGRAVHTAENRHPAPERERRLAALGAVAARRDTALPAELFPQMSVDANCCDQRMCVALCPTAALEVTEHRDGASLHWSSDRCIACGTCVRACPTGALHLDAHGGTPGRRILVTHARLICAGCGDRFTPAAGTDPIDGEPPFCPVCNKARRFMDDARRQLFGPPE